MHDDDDDITFYSAIPKVDVFHLKYGYFHNS